MLDGANEVNVCFALFPFHLFTEDKISRLHRARRGRARRLGGERAPELERRKSMGVWGMKEMAGIAMGFRCFSGVVASLFIDDILPDKRVYEVDGCVGARF